MTAVEIASVENTNERYARRQFRLVMAANAIAGLIALCYVLFAIINWAWGDIRYIQNDGFHFALEFLAFSVVFSGFVWLIYRFVMAGLESRR